MAYMPSGITVDVGPQAVRPREPGRPSVAQTTDGRGMAARALRPREAPVSIGTDQVRKLIASVAKYKGHQCRLKKGLKLLGEQLKLSKRAAAVAAARNDRPGVAVANALTLRLEKAIYVCIANIKDTADKANAAAASAIAKGATREDVKLAAAGAAVETSSAQIPGIESSTASVSPNGNISVGPDATLTVMPTQEPSVPDNSNFKPQDIAVGVSSGSIGTVLFVGALAGLGYLMLKKRGIA